MNLTIERAPALSALSRAVGVVERAQTIPILGNVALVADGAALTLRATNLEMEVVERLDATVQNPGDITVPADKLHAIVQNADAGSQVALALDDGDPRVKVRSGRSNFKLPCLPADLFPEFRKDGLDEGFSMPAKTLADMISRVAWSIEAGDKTSIKGTVFLGTQTVGEEPDQRRELHALGACGTGFSLRRIPAPEGADISAILPARLAAHLVRWLSDIEGDVRISCAYGQGADKPATLMQVRHGDCVTTAKLFDADRYFNYVPNIKEAHVQSAKVARDELSTAIRRVLVMGEGRTGSLHLAFSEGQLAVRAAGGLLDSGEGVDEIGAEYTGPPARLMLKAAALKDALGAMTGDIVEFAFAPASVEGDYLTGLVVLRAPCDEGLVVNMMQMRA